VAHRGGVCDREETGKEGKAKNEFEVRAEKRAVCPEPCFKGMAPKGRDELER
jgi:hypothetical protein